MRVGTGVIRADAGWVGGVICVRSPPKLSQVAHLPESLARLSHLSQSPRPWSALEPPGHLLEMALVPHERGRVHASYPIAVWSWYDNADHCAPSGRERGLAGRRGGCGSVSLPYRRAGQAPLQSATPPG